MKSKISIVMAHYNRFNLLYNTLQSIYKYKNTDDIQTIIVDDGSTDFTDKEKIFEFPIIYIQLPANKWYTNSVIPYNVGIEYAESDIIMIQNPECYHFDDVIKYTLENMIESKYFSYSCYSLPENKSPNDIRFRSDLKMKISGSNGDEGWYNHSIYRPNGHHFCCALHRKLLKHINNFSREYAWGHWYDDNDFVFKIRKSGINIEIKDDLTVLHQYHYNKKNTYDTVNWELVNRNKNIFHNKERMYRD